MYRAQKAAQIAAESSQKQLVDSIRKQCLQKRIGGIKGLSTLFRGMDKDFSKYITLDEFVVGLQRYGIKMAGADMISVFKYFDKDDSGSVDFREFILQLSPPMPECRRSVVREAFERIDVIKDGILKIEDLQIVYRKHAEKHPKYISGECTMDEVLAQFLETFDDPNNKDGMVTPDEFLNYYAEVSSTIADDEYFDLMMRACWGLPTTRKSSNQQQIAK